MSSHIIERLSIKLKNLFLFRIVNCQNVRVYFLLPLDGDGAGSKVVVCC